MAQIEAVTGREVNVLYNPQKAGGVARLAADIGRAREQLGFTPRVELAEGLRLTLARDPRFRS